MLGVSFNTSLGRTGISWQGEISLKNDVPLQIDDVELLFATLSTLAPQFGANNQIGNFLANMAARFRDIGATACGPRRRR